MLELYHAHISTCSQKVRLCLAEKAFEWTSHPIEFAKGQHLTPDYLELNPNGVVPTLVHDGRAVIDSSVICEYLEEIAPHSGTELMPSDSYGRARVRAWLRYIEEVPTAAIRIPSFNSLFLGSWRALNDSMRAAYVAATPLRKSHYRRFGTTGFPEEEVADSLARLRQTAERVEAATASGPWLSGAFSLADICVLPTFVRLTDIGLESVWGGLDRAQAWYARMRTRPSFGAAFYPESRVSPLRSVS
jgi:glutathione S-transferase